MKKLNLLILIAILCAALQTGADRLPKKSAQGISASAELLRTHVKELSGIQPARNSENAASLDRAADYIVKQARQWTNRVDIQAYKVKGIDAGACPQPKRASEMTSSFLENLRKKTRFSRISSIEYKNVLISFGPEKGERIVVGAHYDVWGEQPGADDNATGAAALLELVRLFSLLEPALKYRVDLAAYTLEEPPFFRTLQMGSAVHAQSLKEAGVKVRLMISIDMIGYFSTEAKPHGLAAKYIKPGKIKPGLSTSLVGKKGDEKMTRRIARLMQAGGGGIAVIAFNMPRDSRGVDFSDHLNFWKRGYPGVMLTNFWVCASPFYHTAEDVMDHIDFGKMALIVKGLYNALINY